MLFGVAPLEPELAKVIRQQGRWEGSFFQVITVFPAGEMSSLAEGKLAQLLHGFSNGCPFSIIGSRTILQSGARQSVKKR